MIYTTEYAAAVNAATAGIAALVRRYPNEAKASLSLLEDYVRITRGASNK